MRILIAALLFVAPACASTGSQAGDGEREERDLLTFEQIQTAPESSAYAIIQSHRPSWLRTRPKSVTQPTEVRLYVDGIPRQDVNELRTVRRENIREMRFYDATSAQTRWGLDHVNGAIVVTLRRR